ncbi:MAG: sulfatase [Cyclobacteriaceae bacterium]
MRNLIIVTFLVFNLCTTVCTSQPRPEKPNVILILADDLGWQDLGCYDIDEPTPYESPNLDKFSETGVKFWQAYSPAPTCSPSRGAILAGKHPARLQRTHVVGGAPPVPGKENSSVVTQPWYSGRLPVSEVIIPEVLKQQGYVSGHVGKWHIAINHHAYPQPEDHGFDFTISDRGVNTGMKPNRLADFATKEADDVYRIDENGFPRDPNNENAIDFIKKSKDKPFFLYYATWLVHAPIQTRSRRLLEKYCIKMGLPFPADPGGIRNPGQNNPYYGAMVEMFDYYMGQLFQYLENTEDPRWPGHKLSENTYIIFTSDNGGMEGSPKEIYTDNYPLDKGKINAKEGGVRVPLIIAGPGIKPNQESHVMVNGIDFFPTIMSWTSSKHPNEQDLDGISLAELLASDVDDSKLLRDSNGEVRDEVIYHFPHGAALHATLRKGDYKFIHNYDPRKEPELYRLYDSGEKRVDIEEMINLAADMPEKVTEMKSLLFDRLRSMDSSMPFLNPYANDEIENKEQVCTVTDDGRDGNKVWVNFEKNGNKVTRAYLLYTLNGGEQYEEWYRTEAIIESNGRVIATIPEGATHYIFNLVDEHQFMVSHPRMGSRSDYKGGHYSVGALDVKDFK